MSLTHQLQNAALLGHISSQMQLNVAFLESQNYLSAQDAATMREIIGRLPVQAQSTVVTTSHVNVVSAPVVGGRAIPPPRQVPALPLTAAPAPVYARATWGYNEDGAEANDLSFAAGEMVEIVQEKNDDWWLGKARGKEGLFPSNHVEKVDTATPGAVVRTETTMTTTTPAGKPYRPFGAALHGTDIPPANGSEVNSIGLQQASGQAEKKSRFGSLGNTMANSAAGGVGFGAGAAIGSGLVRAIF